MSLSHLAHLAHGLQHCAKEFGHAVEEGGTKGGAKAAGVTAIVATGAVLAAPAVLPLAVGATVVGGLIGAFGKKLKDL